MKRREEGQVQIIYVLRRTHLVQVQFDIEPRYAGCVDDSLDSAIPER